MSRISPPHGLTVYARWRRRKPQSAPMIHPARRPKETARHDDILQKIRNRLSLAHEQSCLSACQDRWLPSQRQGKGLRKIFPAKGSRNPLKSLDSDERIQGNPTPRIGGFRRETVRRQGNPNGIDRTNGAARRREGAPPTPSNAKRPGRRAPPSFSSWTQTKSVALGIRTGPAIAGPRLETRSGALRLTRPPAAGVKA